MADAAKPIETMIIHVNPPKVMVVMLKRMNVCGKRIRKDLWSRYLAKRTRGFPIAKEDWSVSMQLGTVNH